MYLTILRSTVPHLTVVRSHHFLFLYFLLLCACNTQSTRPAVYSDESSRNDEIHEELLLDIGIGIFDPGVEGAKNLQAGIYPDLRRAESRYLPYQLSQVLQSTSTWGSVRIVPDRLSEMDIWIDGEIIKSDGRNLVLRVIIHDSTGKIWLKKEYKEPFARTYPDAFTDDNKVPFNKLYLAISADLSDLYTRFSGSEIINIRKVTELKFGQNFSPAIFSGYLSTDSSDNYKILRLPAAGSTDWERLIKIRLRDKIFIEVLQHDYEKFYQQMHEPYLAWLRESYRESLMLTSLREESNSQILAGILKIFSSLNPLSLDRFGDNSMGPVGFAAGKEKLEDGIAKRREARIHLVGLQELGASLSSAIQPHVLQLDESTFQLVGTAKDQYSAWQKILYQYYILEEGEKAVEY